VADSRKQAAAKMRLRLVRNSPTQRHFGAIIFFSRSVNLGDTGRQGNNRRWSPDCQSGKSAGGRRLLAARGFMETQTDRSSIASERGQAARSRNDRAAHTWHKVCIPDRLGSRHASAAVL